MELRELSDGGAQGAASRSRLYQVLSCSFAFPEPDIHEAVRDGTLLAVLHGAAAALPYALPAPQGLDAGSAGESYAELESEYIRLFDVGAAGPPCPLYGGVYAGDRMKTMEDATRFYNFFHLRLSPEMRELPDHLTTELEFLHYLTFREAEVRETGGDPLPLLRAQRDFLARHPCKWLPRLQGKLAGQRTLPFFPALTGFARSFFDADRTHAAALCGEG